MSPRTVELANEALRNESRFRALSAATANILSFAGAEGRLVDEQPQWSEFTGQAYSGYSGLGWLDAIHPDDQEFAKLRWGLMTKTTAPFRFEHRVRRADGEYRTFAGSATPIMGPSGAVVEWLIVHSDVSDRRAADDKTAGALRELNDLKAAIDEHAIVAITDHKGKITYVNDKFCAISKYAREELIGQDHRVINSGYHPKQFIRSIWQTISTGRVWKGELKNKAKDGTYYWVDTTIVPYLDRDGKPLQYIAIRADITERKQAESALQRAQADLREHATTLEATVEARTAALRETIGELESFSYSVSHDMRAPLRAMQSFARILEEECAGAIGENGRDYVRRISSAAARMDSLIQDVLTYSRVARTDLPVQPIRVGRLLNEILQTYPAFQEPAATVAMRGEFPVVMAIPAVLTQCFSNLIGNAVKFVPPGARPRVEVWAEDLPGGDKVRVFVKDNGVGIEKEMHEKIYAIFHRVSKSYEGTGIGLSIVKKGVERMGGAVGLESELGRGSTFWLDLRKEKTAATATAAA